MAAVRRLDVTDRDTGEVVGSTDFTVREVRRRVAPQGEFALMIQDAHARAFMQMMGRDLSGPALRVFWALLAHLDYGNLTHISQEEIGEFLGMARPNVSRALAELSRQGVLRPSKNPHDKRVRDYSVHPALVWKGSASERKAALLAFKPKGVEAVLA